MFKLDLLRDSFISTLTKYTYFSNPVEIRQKNIDSFKKMLKIAQIEGNSLGASWFEVLKCISMLERLQQTPGPEVSQNIVDLFDNVIIDKIFSGTPALNDVRPLALFALL